MNEQRPLPTQREIERTLAAAAKHGLIVRRYRVSVDGVEVDCLPDDAGDDIELIDWTKK